MKLRQFTYTLLALTIMPQVCAAFDRETFCDIDREISATEVNCRVDVSAPTGSGNQPAGARIREWDNPGNLAFQVCNEWNARTTARNRSLTFAEIEVKAPDKPGVKGLLVLSAQQASGLQYLVIDWAAPTSTEATAATVLPLSKPVAVAPISACTPVLADPFWNIGTGVKIVVTPRNEIEIAVSGQASLTLRPNLGSSTPATISKVRVSPSVFDYADGSLIRTLWFIRY